MPDDATARILVVDDETSITDSVVMALRYGGYEVAVAHSGAKALEALAERYFDLLVLDVMLPGINGLDVTRRIRAAGSEVPALLLTAKAAVNDRVAGLSVGGWTRKGTRSGEGTR